MSGCDCPGVARKRRRKTVIASMQSAMSMKSTVHGLKPRTSRPLVVTPNPRLTRFLLVQSKVRCMISQ